MENNYVKSCSLYLYSGFITGPRMSELNKDRHFNNAFARPTYMEFVNDKIPLLMVLWENGHLTTHKIDATIQI